MDLIPDDELERLAVEHGPGSVEAKALAELRQERAQDKQVSAYRLGKFVVIGRSRRRKMSWCFSSPTRRRNT